jgi:hypothetical protein
MSRPPALAVLGYSGAAMFLRRVPASDIAGVISIHGHREFGVEAGVACRLDLTFDDVEVAPPGDVQAIERVMARKRELLRRNGRLVRALAEVRPDVK